MNIGYGFEIVFAPAPSENISASIVKNGRKLVSRFAPTESGALVSLLASAPFLRESQIVAIQIAINEAR